MLLLLNQCAAANLGGLSEGGLLPTCHAVSGVLLHASLPVMLLDWYSPGLSYLVTCVQLNLCLSNRACALANSRNCFGDRVHNSRTD